ncbi:MAG: glutamate--tRNA ligase [Proteobacteria bacterium]|nr:glutamate--tRNA ligase [Pseudomonadota bacterium]MBI3497762.1 glutamate--tRNA ligase [Pseudomonadota bacterium]
MSVLVRIAPSPTGRLHIGNSRTALVNWLFARRQGGRFLLRLDDTDMERSTAEFALSIEEDMRWLGLDWDLFARQSDRMGRYAEAEARLKAMGRLYPCYESPEELALRRKVQLAAGKPPIYDRAGLSLTEADCARFEAEGRRPHWRFKLEHGPIAWTDLVRGAVVFDGAKLGDPVLVRADGRPIYGLASVVDDIDFKVSHIIRGEDHVDNTAVHIQLFRALAAPVPEFAHLPLIADTEGGKLSKRIGSLGVAELRRDGIEPMALNSLLAHLGTSDAIEPHGSLEALAQHFDLGHFARSTPRFDPHELEQLNHRLIQTMPFHAVADRLNRSGIDADERFWLAVKPNLTRIADAASWWQVCRGAVAPAIADPGFTETARSLLPPEPWDEATWGRWTDEVKAATARKGKALFLPLRLALTGRDHGPELRNLLPLIGRARAEARLGGKTA